MPFIHPILFWLGVAGISIPIIIHILNRRRFRIVEWAAMKFLLDALRKNRKRLRIEELILLALRCLIVLLLGLALGRFVGCSAVDTLGIGDGGSSIVFILDDSYSMAQARGRKTEFGCARDDLKKQIESLGGKDQVAILLTSRPGREDAFFRFGEITDRPALLGRMDTLQPSDLRISLADSLQTAANLLKGTAGQKQLYVFGDFRRVDLADESQVARMKTIYADLQAAGVKVIAMDYGREARNNLTIEKIELLDKFAVSGQSVRIALTVKNNGQVLARNVPIDMSVMFYDGKKMRNIALPIQTIESLEPNQFWRREISFTPETPVATVIAAKLPDDDLPGDNRAMVSLDVRKATKVLIVDGRPGGARAEDAESYFLRLALDPARDSSHGFAVETISRDDLSDAVFGDYDVVFLLDLENFPIQPLVSKDGETTENYLAVARLEKFVAAGGGLVIFTGDKVDTDFYNGRLYKKGAGLNPLPIRSRMGNPRNQEKYFTIDPKSIKPTGIMSFFSGEASAIAKLIRFFAFTPADDKNLLTADKIAAAPVIEATFNDRNASPAVVSRRYGRGQVVVVYSTASLRWNDWAVDSVDDVTGLYVLYMAELTERLSRPQDEVFTRTAGSDICFMLEPSLRDATVKLTPPGSGADLVTLAVDTKTARPRVAYEKARSAGVYRMTFTQPDKTVSEVLFARNPDPTEGDLTPGGRDELTAALGNGDYVYISRGDASGEDEENLAEQKDYWIWLIAALLVLLATETYLARKFGHW